MNEKAHQNIDPRPKRRKAKDNPYTLFTVGMPTGKPQYYVAFQAASGHRVCLEVERDVFEAMDRFELDDLRYLNEMDNHYERSELTEATLYRKMARKAKDTEEIILNQMRNEELQNAITQLPATQRRRFVLYYHGQFTYKQIAQMESCSIAAVKSAVDAAINRLKKYFEQGV